MADQGASNFKYDVFLSFRGEDTRFGFTNYLYHSLKEKSVNVFRDDSGLGLGDEIGSSLIEAIKSSRVFIVVISPRYGSSAWCLDELVNIMECSHNGTKRHVFPIFYHVEISDVRYQNKQYKDDMEKHERRYGKDSEKVKAWRSALTAVCNLSGKPCTDKGMFETDIINQIVEEVLKKLSTEVESQNDVVGFVGEDVVGFVNDFNVVIERLKEKDSHNNVVSIIGMGGLGKTTLAQKIYNSNEMKKWFQCRAWSCVSKDYNKKEVLLSILGCLISSTSEFKDPKVELQDIMKKLRECLRKKKFLIVLDDIWDPEAWDDLKETFPSDNNGSKILITSRNEKVAYYTSTRPPHYLPFLDAEEGWKLFCRKVFFGEECPSNLEPLGRPIVESCGGFPLAIVTLAGLVAKKRRTERDWLRIKGDIHWHLAQGETQKVMNVLKLSYDDLPPRLKPCFLYFGIYPEDTEISAAELVRLWVAEKFIPKSNAVEVEPEDVGEEYLDELVDRCLVQVVSRRRSDGGVKTCKIHDLLRDLCILEGRANEFLEVCTESNFHALKDPHSRHRLSLFLCNVKSYIPSPDECERDPSSEDSLTLSFISRRLYVLNKLKSYMSSIKPNESSSSTRSLFVFGEHNFPQDIFRSFPSLSVLHIGQESYFANKTLMQLKAMTHLRYLKLGRLFYRHERLPDCIWSLPNLETVHARGWATFTSDGIWRLERLRHVCVRLIPYQPKKGQGVNSKSMWNLQNLSEVILNPKSGGGDMVFNNVGSLPNLKRLALWFSDDDDGEQLKTLHCLSNLHTLRISCCRYLEEDTKKVSLDALRGRKRWEDPRAIVSLESIAFPSSITKITLKGITGLDSNNMSAVLGRITNLRVLKLVYPKKGSPSSLCCGAIGDFPQLLEFHLREMGDLEELVLEEGVMPRLKRVVIRDCIYLKKVSPRLMSLANLQWLHHPEDYCGPSLNYLETSC